MSSLSVFLVFFIFRISDVLTSFFAQYVVPYLGFFPYKEVLNEYHLPQFISSFANFDGTHYLLIARQGYSQYEQAFFPLYPLLIRYLSPLFANNHLLTAFLISNVSFFIGLTFFLKYFKLVCHPELDSEPVPNSIRESEIRSRNKFGMTRNTSLWILLFLVTFPTSFFFGAVYTEGLFFLLFISALYFLKKEKYLPVAIFAFLASLTKLIGVFLIIPIFLSQIPNPKSLPRRQAGQIHNSNLKSKKHWKLEIGNWKFIFALISPLLGLLAYSLYLLKTTGDPLFFLHSQWAFGANRSSNLVFLPQVYYRYFNIFFTAAWNFQYFISLFEFLTFNFVFIIVILNLFQDLKQIPKQVRNDIGRLDRLGLSLFSLINLILPTLTGTLSSIPRYALFSLSFFLFLSQIRNTPLKISIAIIFLLLHIIMLGFFIQGYFVS